MKFFRILTVVFVVIGAIAFVFAPQSTQAQTPTLSAACANYGGNSNPTALQEDGAGDGPFNPGETIVVTAALAGTSTAATFGLYAEVVGYLDPPVTPSLAGPASVPGTLTYVIPTTSPAIVYWYINTTDDAVNVVASCLPAGVAAAAVAPGCDALVAIPDQAVVGTFTAYAPIYWTPGELVSPTVTIDVGKSYYVAGQDATGMYRKVLLGCQWVWVEADTVGPNYDDVWNGTPLPTDVVE